GEPILFPEPRVVPILVGVHRPAEDQNGAVAIERARQRRPPRQAPLLEPMTPRLDDVAEDAGPHTLSVNDREDVHQPRVVTGTFAACSRRCSALAFAAACAIRPPCPSGLVALLLKNAKACSAFSPSSRNGPAQSRSSSSEDR